MVTKTKINLNESQCQAILNEAAEVYSQRGTTENFLHILIRLAYQKGFDAADLQMTNLMRKMDQGHGRQ